MLYKSSYVFEVQSKGSIDSLILNLKKAQSNAAVQAVVAVADEEQLADLANIMGQNYDLFEVHIVSLEWAKQIFTTLEKSRNVIMHSGELGERDIERIGINIRDWISQVGA